jgi:hypothetical protein
MESINRWDSIRGFPHEYRGIDGYHGWVSRETIIVKDSTWCNKEGF